MNILEKKLK